MWTESLQLSSPLELASAEENCLAQARGSSPVSLTQWLIDQGTGLFQPKLGQRGSVTLTSGHPRSLAEAVARPAPPQLLPLTTAVCLASLLQVSS